MLLILKFILILFNLLILGYFCLFLIRKKNGFLCEDIALSFGLGCGFYTIYMFILSMLGISFSRFILLLPNLIIFILLLFYYRKSIHFVRYNLNHDFFKDLFFLDYIFIGIIIFCISFVILQSYSLPYVAWDCWANWGLKGNILYLEKGINFGNFTIDYSNRGVLLFEGYPFLVPLVFTYLYVFLGGIYENLGILFLSLFYVSSVIIFYYFLIRFSSRSLALVFTAWLATLPKFMQWSYSGYADIPLSYYILVSATLVYMYIAKLDNSRLLMLASIFIGFSVWTKNEGLAFWLGLILSLTILRLANRRLLYPLCIVPFLINLPFFFVKVFLKLNLRYKLPLDLNQTYIDKLMVTIKLTVKELMKVDVSNIYWLAFFIIFIFYVLRIKKYFRKPELFFSLVIIFQIFFYMISYVLDPMATAALVHIFYNSFSRIILHIIPLAFLFIFFVLTSWRQRIEK